MKFTVQVNNLFHVISQIADYLEKEWSCRAEIPANPPEFFVWTFESFDGVSAVSLNLGIHRSIEQTMVLTIYCPFLMVNKTERFLSYKVRIIIKLRSLLLF